MIFLSHGWELWSFPGGWFHWNIHNSQTKGSNISERLWLMATRWASTSYKWSYNPTYRGPITPRPITGKGPTLWCTNSISFLFQHLGRIGKTVTEHQVLLSQKSGSPPRMMIIPLFRQGFNHPRWWSPDFWTINSMVYPIPQPGNWDALEESWRILCKEIHRKSSARKIWKESRNTNMFQVGGKYIPRKDCHVF